jgi:hypothetical protein
VQTPVQGDELGLDNRFDSFIFPQQVNKMEDFPVMESKATIFGAAAAVLEDIWKHCQSAHLEPLREAFSGLVRISLADPAAFALWYNALVDEQIACSTTDPGRAGYLSKKKTKVLRRALPASYLEKAFERLEASDADQDVMDYVDSVSADAVELSIALLDCLDQQRPALSTTDNKWYSAQTEPPQAEVPLEPVPAPLSQALPAALAFELSTSDDICAHARHAPGAFVTLLHQILITGGAPLPLLRVPSTERLTEEQAQQLRATKSAAVSCLVILQAVHVQENRRGPSNPKIVKRPVEHHLAEQGHEGFTTHRACEALLNVARPAPPIFVSWPPNTAAWPRPESASADAAKALFVALLPLLDAADAATAPWHARDRPARRGHGDDSAAASPAGHRRRLHQAAPSVSGGDHCDSSAAPAARRPSQPFAEVPTPLHPGEAMAAASLSAVARPQLVEEDMFRDDDEDVQRTIALDVLRPQLLNALRNVFHLAAVHTRTASDLRAHVQQEHRLCAEESRFCAVTKRLLDHGVTLAYLQHALDDMPDYSPEYRQIYREWVLAATLQSGHATSLLEQGALPQSSHTAASSAHDA